MSLKPCTFNVPDVKGAMSYDQMRQYLLDNPQLWEGKKVEKVSPTKVTINKFTKNIADKFAVLSKAMGFDVKLNFIGPDEASQIMQEPMSDRNKVLYHIIGKNAQLTQNMKDQYAEAVTLSKKNVDAREIKLRTNWEKGADGKWKYEIEPIKINPAYWDTHFNRLKKNLPFGTMVSDIVGKNSELLKFYPSLGNIRIKHLVEYPNVFNGGFLGSYNYRTNSITLYSILNVKYTEPEMFYTLLHELQHAIQIKENFAIGGNPDTTQNGRIINVAFNYKQEVINDLAPKLNISANDLDKGFGSKYRADVEEYIKNNPPAMPISAAINIPDFIKMFYSDKLNDAFEFFNNYKALNKDHFQAYQALAGEQEAENVVARYKLYQEDMAKRRLILLEHTEQLGRDEQIVIFNKQGAQVTDLDFFGRMSEGGRTPMQPTDYTGGLQDFVTKVEEMFGVKLEAYQEKNGDISLDRIIVPQDMRKSGIGTSVMFEIMKYADTNNKRLTLTPTTEFGATSMPRLMNFYKRFGFVTNAGKNKDFTTKAAMYRNPQAVQPETTFTATRTGTPIGYAYDTNQTARARFDLAGLKKIGSGSDRDVFDLGNGMVLKIAKDGRGLEQNIYEGDSYLVKEGLLPPVFERGLNYVVVANAPKIKAGDLVDVYEPETGDKIGTTTAAQMLKELDAFTQRDFDNRTSELQDVINKYGFSAALDYEIIYNDFAAKRNWGYINGKPVHVDGGTFGGIEAVILHRDRKLNEADFRKIYNDSKRIKKEYGDTDKHTRYMRTEEGNVLGFVQRQDDGSYKVYINPKVVNPETPIHEIAGHIFLPLIQQTNPELYAKGVELIQDSPYMDRVKQLYPDLNEQEQYEEALALAIGEKGVQLQAEKRKGFVTWLKTFWQKTQGVLGIKTTPEQLAAMNIEQFTDLVAGSILNAEQLAKIKETAIQEQAQLSQPSEDPVHQLTSASTEEGGDAAFTAIVEQQTDGENEGMPEYDAERPQGKTFIQALKDDVKAFLLNGQSAISKYSQKAQDYIKTISAKTRNLIAVGVISAGLIPTGYMTVSAFYDIPSPRDIYQMADRALTNSGVVDVDESEGKVDTKTVMQAKPQPVVIKADTQAKAQAPSVTFFTRGKVKDTRGNVGDSLWMFVRDADNGNLVYVPGPHKHNVKAYGASGVAGVEGVGHFLITPEDLTHLTSNELLQDLKHEIVNETKKLRPFDYIPAFEKMPNNLIKLTFKKHDQIGVNDVVMTRLNQFKYTDINWESKANPKQFQRHIFCLTTNAGQMIESLVMSPTNTNYNRFSGGSFYILAETKSGLKIREMSGSLAMLKADAMEFAAKNNVSLDKITIGIMDAGSYSAKPVANRDKVVYFKQYSGFNRDVGGAALYIPSGGGVQFRKALEMSENMENSDDNIAGIVSAMNTLPGVRLDRNIYPISQSRGQLKTGKIKRKGIVKPVPIVSLNDFIGKQVLFTPSDELTTGSITNPVTGQTIGDLKGGIFYPYSQKADRAWAFGDTAVADNLLQRAKALYNSNPAMYPDKIVPVAVVKMGKEAMASNEAVSRQLSQNVAALPEANKTKAMVAIKEETNRQIERLNELKDKKGKLSASEKGLLNAYKAILNLSENVKGFDDLVSKIPTLGILHRPALVKMITTGSADTNPKKIPNKIADKPVLKALLENTNYEDIERVHIGRIVAGLTDPIYGAIPDRHIMAFVGVDITADKPVDSGHKNYPFALAGKGLGVLANTVHIADAAGSAYAAIMNKIATNSFASEHSSDSSLISNAFSSVFNNKFLTGQTLATGIDDYAKLIGALKTAFPSVNFFTDADSWNNILADDSVKKYIKNGEVVYGLTKDGNIYLNPDAKDFNTPIHEVGHIWVDMLEQSNNKMLQRGFDLLNGTKELAQAIAQYGDNVQARKEALAVLIGNKGESIVIAATQAKFKSWLQAAFEYVKSTFKSLSKYKANEIQNITLNQFIEGAIADILGGQELAGQVVATSEPQFKKTLPTKLRNAIQDLINEQKANPKKIFFYEVVAKARGLMRAAGLSEDEIDAQVKAMEEREEAKTESEYFSDYVSKLKAAAKLTIPEARSLMRQFRNFLNSEEDLDTAISFVDRLVKKKELLEQLNKAKDAYKSMVAMRNSPKLTAAEQKFLSELQVPKFYLLDESTLIKLREMANDFVNSRKNQTKSKFELREIDAAFNQASTVQSPKTKRTGKRKIAPLTRAEKEFRLKEALKEYANEIPAAKELAAMDISLLDNDSLSLAQNALRVYDETGRLFSLPAIVETARALNDAKKIQSSGVIANIKKLAAAGISARLQSIAANADEIRKILVGGWDRNAGRVTIETQELRKQVNDKFEKLKLSQTDKFVLGAYGFFKEETTGQPNNLKASVLASQMNNLNKQIQDAKKMNSDNSEVGMLEHYYKGNTDALVALGAIRKDGGEWVANEDFDIETSVSPNIAEAWKYAQSILQPKAQAYANAMAEYHGKDFEQIFQYYPRSFYKSDVLKSELDKPSEELPPLGSIDPQITKQTKEIAARNEGRSNIMPRVGGFYILDGYENLINGVWDINATIELSKSYAYTNALINKANITTNANTNRDIKKYVISSVKGILRDPMIFPDNRVWYDKVGSTMFNFVTTTILNNFTQLAKQPMATLQGFRINPGASMKALKLIMKGMTDPKTAQALDKFFKNTSEPYTQALSYIELDAISKAKATDLGKINKIFEYINPEYLVKANRFTQRLLLLSGYLGKKDVTNFIEEAQNGFDEIALAAAENNAEAANSTANRHFLPQELKDAGTLKKFLYFLGTYNFVVTTQFWNNLKILQGPGYTESQKALAQKQMTGLVIQQVMFQLVTRGIREGLNAIGENLGWLDEEDEEEEEKRRAKYWYQVPAQVVADLMVGPMVGLVGDALKSATVALSDEIYSFYKNDPSDDSKLDALYKRSSDFPGVYGVLAPLIGQAAEAGSKVKDESFQTATALQGAAMLMAWGDLYYLARLKANNIRKTYKTAGGDEVLKAYRGQDSEMYRQWVSSVYRKNLSKDMLTKMSWQEDGKGYLVPIGQVDKFVEVYNQSYSKELRRVTLSNKMKIKKRQKSQKDLVKQAETAAAIKAQSKIKNPVKFIMPQK